MNYRITENGNLVYPHRGKPPDEGEHPGYERDELDPYVFVPLFRDCIYRYTVPILKPCGKYRAANCCSLLNNREVSVNFCDACDKAK